MNKKVKYSHKTTISKLANSGLTSMDNTNQNLRTIRDMDYNPSKSNF